ncbi:uncharacterized protein LOC114266380 isoform X2 [Camellia sinensis]|uniref:uncharacterized protein LOC114266380 isoform X1 n=2 Tax=Camellia sinensis TaxID=4442 RepID=UPI0010367BC3|nr:uncharacterized protein LOC114266380 isoform X1 [Camellia sinensis]XP_028063071.1 uncharacterized protein LOC114266380 isoform X1 [Camellia sinensis]XP_028063077.1 uncharacterized protein LOC114266380 isoform X2 [Camellia sinensis]
MIMYEQDLGVLHWGLPILDVCCISTRGSPGSSIYYDQDLSRVEYVNEGYGETKHDEVENDEIIARAFQEELSLLADAKASGCSYAGDKNLQASILTQDWLGTSKRHYSLGTMEEPAECGHDLGDVDEREESNSCSSTKEKAFSLEDGSYLPEIADESTLDGDVGKRLNQMVPVAHVPKINGYIPSVDEETSDHQRLLDRLRLYDLVELKVQGDGNCQFRALSDQIYRTTEHHQFVRQQVVDQLKLHPELYEVYVPMAYDDYLKNISKSGEWGDHVTLQAAADAYGIKIFIITSFKDTCYIEILPRTQNSKRIIFLSFWAEVHYNSIYTEGDLSPSEMKKNESWWML